MRSCEQTLDTTTMTSAGRIVYLSSLTNRIQPTPKSGAADPGSISGARTRQEFGSMGDDSGSHTAPTFERKQESNQTAAGIERPGYRLRVGQIRVFSDVRDGLVE